MSLAIPDMHACMCRFLQPEHNSQGCETLRAYEFVTAFSLRAQALGAAALTKRPTSVMLVLAEAPKARAYGSTLTPMSLLP